MSLNGRISDLERRESDGQHARCPVCKDWPPARVVYDPPQPERQQPKTPDHCWVCGWEQQAVHVRYSVKGEE